jgi:hypothetical protein
LEEVNRSLVKRSWSIGLFVYEPRAQMQPKQEARRNLGGFDLRSRLGAIGELLAQWRPARARSDIRGDVSLLGGVALVVD